MSAPMMSSSQSLRLKALVSRLAMLEETATSLTTTPLLTPKLKPLSPAESALHRAKALEARVTRLELAKYSHLDDVSELLQVESRLSLLESGVVRLQPSQCEHFPNISRVLQALKTVEYMDFELLRVPDATRYYQDFSLHDRAALLQASSVHSLCKTLLFSTTGEEENVETLFLLVVNYSERISAAKLKQALRTSKTFPVSSRKTCKQVSSDGMFSRLGFPPNGVCVVGGLTPLPIVFAQSVAQQKEIFLGGGEVNVKLHIRNVPSFIRACQGMVLDVTDPRGEEEEGEDHGVAKEEEKVDVSPPPAAATTSTTPGPAKSDPTAARGKRAFEGGEEDKDDTVTFDDLDCRVGQITRCWKHPESTKLLCEVIDLGEPTGPREIASGIQAYYPDPEELVGKKVLVLANLKPAKLGGFMSNGMVLCASWEDQVKIVEPPSNALLGSRVVYQKKRDPPATAAQLKKKKILEQVFANLCLDKVDGTRVVYLDKPLTVEGVDGENCVFVPNGKPGAHVS